MHQAFRRAGVFLAVVLTTSLTVFVSPAGALEATSTSPADGSTVQPPATVFAVHDGVLDTAESTIELRNKNNTLVGGSPSFTMTVLPNDTIVFTPAAPLTDAGSPYTATVHAEDLVLPATADTVFTFTVDSVAPADPTITSVTNPVNASNQDEVAVSGAAETGATVLVTIDDQNAGTDPVTDEAVAVGSAYTASVDVTSLDDGTLDVTATATDEAGNESGEADSSTTKDASVPAAPGVSIDDDPIDVGNQGSVTISGTSGEEDLTVDVSVDDASHPATAPVLASTTTTGDGSWTVEVDLSTLEEGTITASATVEDAAGNTSTAGTDTATKELGSPIIVSTTPDGDSSVQTAPEVTATYSEPLDTEESTIVVTDETDTPVAGVTTFRDLNHTIVFTPTEPFTEGGSPYTATLAVEDPAGNAETPATVFEFSIDTTAPDAPTVEIATDPIVPANEATVSIEGTAEVGAIVDVTLTDEAEGEVTDDTIAAGDGSWSVVVDASALDDGTLTATATATDPAGNESEPATDTAIKDTTAPDAPVITSVTDPVNASNADTFVVEGTAEDGSTVEVTVEDDEEATVTDSATADAEGFTVTLDVSGLADGTLTVTAVATDPVDNESATSDPETATKDTVAPAAPVITSVTDPVTPANSAAVIVQGTGPAGTTIDVTVEDDEDDTSTGSGASDGDWSVSVDVSALSAGELTVVAVAVDAAGNESAPSAPATTDKIATTVTFQTTQLPGVNGTYRPVPGDFDGDGEADIVWYAPGTTADRLWRSDGDGTFTSTALPAINGTTYRPVPGDFDDDGDTDILWYAPGTTADRLWSSDGDGTFTSTAAPAINGTYFPVPGDFDGDEDGDILFYAPGATAERLWFSDGDGTFTSTAAPAVNGTYIAAPGDFDGDGDTDIVWYAPGTASDRRWRTNGDGTFTSFAIDEDGTYIPVIGDFNGDGRDDYFRYVPGSGADVLTLQLVGNRTYNIAGSFVPIAGDHDDDGDTDIVWYAPGTAADFLSRAIPS